MGIIRKNYRSLLAIVVGATLIGVAMNWFIASAGLYVGGVTGISQLIVRTVYGQFGFNINLGLLVWVINIPLLFIAYKVIGKRFALTTLFTVTMTTLMFNIVPRETISDDLFLNLIFGGALNAAGMGIVLKYGGSTGGFDVLFQYLSMKKSGSFGRYSFYVNCVIIAAAGYLEGWETAFYTILLIFIQMQVVDHVHAPHHRYTIFIVTNKREEVIETLQKRLERGITVMNGEGAYTQQSRSVLMMVVASYEVYIALQTLHQVDPFAFTNVLQSAQIQGNFERKIVDKVGS